MNDISRKLANLILFTVLMLSIASCGGGGSNDQKKVESAAILSASPQLSVNENETYSFTITAQNFKSSALKYSATNLPSWAQINESTGTVTGIPSFDDAGIYPNIIVTGTAGGQSASLNSFQIEVVNINVNVRPSAHFLN